MSSTRAGRPALLRSIRGWLHFSDASMAVRAEKILVLCALVIRGTFVLQLAVTVVAGRRQARDPDLFTALSLAMIAESVALAWVVLRRGRYLAWAAVLDIIIVTGLGIAEAGAARPEEIVGSWVSWAYAGAIASAVPAGIGLRQWRLVLGGAFFAAVGYMVSVLPHHVPAGAHTTALTNSLAVLGFSVSCRLAGGFVRIMGEEADRAREAEASAAAAAQLERQRTLLHNHASVLSLLSRDIPDQRLRESARGAAARGARQIHALLADGAPMPRTDASGDRYLRKLVDEVCDEFTDLPLIKNLDLLGLSTVPRPVADALAEGLRTLLWNVRVHAEADHVTVHGESGDPDGWVVTVTDDGKGFDPGSVDRGFGLREQAGAALTRVGVAVELDSAPGEGTRIRVSGGGRG